MDELLRAIKPDFSLRVVAAVTTGVVAEASARHGLRGVEVVALGRALTAACLLTTLARTGERMRLAMRSSGPLRGLLVDCQSEGEGPAVLAPRGEGRHAASLGLVAAGVVDEPRSTPGTASFRRLTSDDDPGARRRADLRHGVLGVRGCLQRRLTAAEQGCGLTVAAAVGPSGTMTVTRDLGLEQRYQGTVEVVSGEVDRDLEHYLNVSEQLPSVLACEVVLGATGTVQRAAGVLVQTFPGGETDGLVQLRAAIDAGGLTDLLRQDRGCEALIGFSLGGDTFEAMERSTLQFRCTCGMERARSVVAILGAADVEALAGEQERTDVKCEFCGEVYVMTADELRALAAEIRRGRS